MMRRSATSLTKLAGVIALVSALEPVLRAYRGRSERREPVVWAPGPGEAFLLANAEVIDVLTGTVLHKRGVLVRDGRIEDIHTEKKAASREGVKTLDAAGSYVIPGLINAHCHMLLTATLKFSPEVLASMARQMERNFEECVVRGVTTVRDVGTLPLLMDRYIRRVEGGELLGPRVFHAGSFVNAPGGYPDFMPTLPEAVASRVGQFGLAVRTPAEAREAVERNAELGVSLIKTAFDDRSLFVGQKSLPVMDDDSLAALVEAAHERGLKVTVHHRFRAGFRRSVAFGLDGVEHLAADEALEDSDVEAFVAGDRYVVPTVQVGWALSGASRGDPYLDHPLVRRAMANRLETVRGVYPSMCEPSAYRALLDFERCYRDPDYVERRHLSFTLDPTIFTKALVVGQENLNKLYHAGALIGCGNDGGTPQSLPGALGIEMMLLESSTDMKPLDVLQAATVNNARILGVEEELGTVSRGKLADLVLLSGNPLENMRHVLFPRAVFKEGRLVYNDHSLDLSPR